MDRYQDLCREVERKAGRTFEKRSDFEWLSEQLMAETHGLISSSTFRPPVFKNSDRASSPARVCQERYAQDCPPVSLAI